MFAACDSCSSSSHHLLPVVSKDLAAVAWLRSRSRNSSTFTMEMRTVCLVSVWACAFLTSFVMASPSQSRGSSEDVDVFDDRMPLDTYFGLLPPSLVLDEDFADEDEDEDTFTRRRRLLSGVHSRYSGSGRRFRSRPRVFVPRRRPGSRGSSRNNVSPY